MKRLWVVPVVAVLALAGCTTQSTSTGSDGGDTKAAGDGVITVWTLEDVQDRITKTEAIAKNFSDQNGIKVNIVPVAEDQFDQVLTAAAADGKLPDVIAALSLAGVQSLQVNKLLNTDMSAQVVDELGEDTFAKSALDLTQQDGLQLGVPSDAWVQLLLYRKYLLDKAGLAPHAGHDAGRLVHSADLRVPRPPE